MGVCADSILRSYEPVFRPGPVFRVPIITRDPVHSDRRRSGLLPHSRRGVNCRETPAVHTFGVCIGREGPRMGPRRLGQPHSDTTCKSILVGLALLLSARPRTPDHCSLASASWPLLAGAIALGLAGPGTGRRGPTLSQLLTGAPCRAGRKCARFALACLAHAGIGQKGSRPGHTTAHRIGGWRHSHGAGHL